jgi:amino acid transporter
MINKIKNFILGKPKDFFDTHTRESISLIAFLAWVGLGADGISSSCYGPEEAFLALGDHFELAIYLAIATAMTVFVISYAYVQVIELFPAGGGGYRVASRLLGPYAGLVSGSALIVDYILAISISVASGTDAIFSFLPSNWGGVKLIVEISIIITLSLLNLRGMKESIKFLLPIFLGFVVTHFFLITYGIVYHHSGMGSLFPRAAEEASSISDSMGTIFLLSLFLKAFSMGGGTYTGLESVSTNAHSLAEPRIKTAKITMFLIALSLAFTAAGIITLYLLWGANKIDGQTLNATVFYTITGDWSVGGHQVSKILVPIVLLLEAGLLFVAANAGFLSGPSIVANMANDEWMPKYFSTLSSRLVVKNGILFMAITSITTLIITKGAVHLLVVLYSINVFITFSLSLLGLTIYWVRNRKRKPVWRQKFAVSLTGFIICAGILIVIVTEKFYEGGWVTLMITSFFIVMGLLVKNSYRKLKTLLTSIETQFYDYRNIAACNKIQIADKNAPTAAIIVDQNFSSGMNCLLEIKKLFPGIFQNFIFVMVGEVDSNTFREEKKWREMRRKTKSILQKYKNYCNASGRFARAYVGYDTDIVEKLTRISYRVTRDYPKTIFFGTKFILENDNMFNQLIYNHMAYIMQRRLHVKGINMIILPMKI